MKFPVRPELTTAPLASGLMRAGEGVVDNSAPIPPRSDSTYKSGKSVQITGATSESAKAGTGYVFLQLKCDDKSDYDVYRGKRRAMLEIACGSAKNKFPHLMKVVGIAIDAPKFSPNHNSEDFLLLDCSEWTPDLEKRYRETNEGFGFFKTGVLQRGRVFEFPLSPSEE